MLPVGMVLLPTYNIKYSVIPLWETQTWQKMHCMHLKQEVTQVMILLVAFLKISFQSFWTQIHNLLKFRRFLA